MLVDCDGSLAPVWGRVQENDAVTNMHPVSGF